MIPMPKPALEVLDAQQKNTLSKVFSQWLRSDLIDNVRERLSVVVDADGNPLTEAYTAKPWDLVQVDPSGGAFTVTLPQRSANGDEVWLKNVTSDGTAITIAVEDSDDTIDGSATDSLASGYGMVGYVYDASNQDWRKIKTSGGSIEGIVNVKDFGAKGDGSTADDVSIQAAIDSLPAWGGFLFFPPGTYMITAPLEIHNQGSGVGVGCTLIGCSGQPRADGASILRWNGAASGNILELFSREIKVIGLQFNCASATSVDMLVYINESSGGQAAGHMFFQNCRFAGQDTTLADGTADYGVQVGDSVNNHSNLDFIHFLDCEFYALETGGFHIETNAGQSKSNYFMGCTFNSATASQSYKGAGILTVSGSFQLYNCFFTGVERCIFTEAPDDSIEIHSILTERIPRFIDTAFNAAGGTKQWGISVFGGKVNFPSDITSHFTTFADATAYDGELINYSHNGPLVLVGVTFGDGASHVADFKLTQARDSNLIAAGCVFAHDDPFSDNSSTGTIFAHGCKGVDVSNNKVQISVQV